MNEVFPGFDVALWTGILVPTGVPAPIVAKLNAAIVQLLEQPEFRTRLTDQGADPAGTSPAEFRKFIAAEIEKWGRLVKLSGAEVQ